MQKYKAVCLVSGSSVFFVDYSFNSARVEMEKHRERNGSKYEYFYRNTSTFGSL